MTSTIPNRSHGQSIRSSPRFTVSIQTKVTNQTPSHVNETPSNDPPPETSVRQDEEITPKPPRQTPTAPQASPANNPEQIQPPRRITRSTLLVISSELPPTDPAPPPPPEVHLLEAPTPSKTAPPLIPQESEQSPLREPLQSCKKLSRCISEQPSPYAAVRKNYRKHQRRELNSIPYRKGHEAFEGRIIGLLNKIEGGKNCSRQIEGLAERLQRAGSKDILNRHVVAGVRVLLRLARQHNYDVLPKQRQERTLGRLAEEEKRLCCRIEEELDRCDQFTEEQPEWMEADCREHREQLIRRLYFMLRRAKRWKSREAARSQAVEQVERIIGQERGVQRAIALLRSQSQLPSVNIN